jgi:diguanylate cyclase (GGDEF)-like protein/PAS domain S-box-containing protein
VDGAPDESELPAQRALALFKRSSNLLAVIDFEGRFLQVNNAWDRMLGWYPADLLGRPLADLVDEADRDRAGQELIMAQHRGRALFVARCASRDGRRRWVEWSAEADFLAREVAVRGQDVTVRIEAERILRDSERMHRLLVDNLPETSLLMADRDLRVTYLGGHGHPQAGLDPKEFVGFPMSKLTSRQDPGGAELDQRARKALDGEASSLDLCSNLTGQHFTISFLPLRNDDHTQIEGIMMVGANVTGQRAAERALRVADDRFRASFDLSPIGQGLANRHGHWFQVNQALCDLMGYDREELLQVRFDRSAHPDDQAMFSAAAAEAVRTDGGSFEMEGRIFRADGTMLWGQISATYLPGDGGSGYFLVHVQDITERRTVEASLRSQADLDPLTGVLNRRAFDRLLDETIAGHLAAGESAALLFLDLDGFKEVNDSHGHPTGDRVLRAVADRLRSALRGSDELGRLGGDEFGILLRHIGTREAHQLASQLEDTVSGVDFETGAGTVHVGASIGVALLGTGGASSASDALATADAAMYLAKRS